MLCAQAFSIGVVAGFSMNQHKSLSVSNLRQITSDSINVAKQVKNAKQVVDLS